jgi:hypothetical protein
MSNSRLPNAEAAFGSWEAFDISHEVHEEHEEHEI